MEFKEQNPAGNAIVEIEILRQQAMVMGANDRENEDFNNIIKRINDGGYKNPADAVKDAKAIVDAKQAYH